MATPKSVNKATPGQKSHTVGVRELKNRASAILERVEAGERITITRNDREIAQLIPMEPKSLPTLNDRLRAKGWIVREPTMTFEQIEQAMKKLPPLPSDIDADAAIRAILEDRESGF